MKTLRCTETAWLSQRQHVSLLHLRGASSHSDLQRITGAGGCMTDSVGGSGADGTEEEGEEEEPWVGHYLPLPDEKDRPSNQVSRSPVANPPPPTHTPSSPGCLTARPLHA